jgi:hypothetical protein
MDGTIQEVKELEKCLIVDIPNCTVEVDLPDAPTGMTWIDVRSGTFQCTITWSAATDFGFFTNVEKGYGDRPNERYKTWQLAEKRVLQLWKGWNGAALKPCPPGLAEVRELVGVTQADLASVRGVSQNAISKFEHRDDALLSTLCRWAEAMGGTCEVRVHFPDFDCSLTTSNKIREYA